MKKIVFLCVLSVVLFTIFYLNLTSPTLGRPLGWELLSPTIVGVGALWSLFEALYTVMRLYIEPRLKWIRF